MRKNLLKKLLLACLPLAGSFLFSGSVLAEYSPLNVHQNHSEYTYASETECPHLNTHPDHTEYTYLSKTECQRTEYEYCEDCGAAFSSKMENSEHVWQEVGKRFLYVSDTVCQQRFIYQCKNCGGRKVETEDLIHKKKGWHQTACTKYSATQHAIIYQSECSNCKHTFQQRVLRDHVWKLTVTGSPEYYSATQHSIKKKYCCTYENSTTTYAAKRNHSFNQYGICSGCEFGKSTEVVLRPGVLTNGNTNTWFKLTVPKNGYIVLNKVSWGGRYFNLYNSKKRLYSMTAGTNAMNGYIPVTKGTYYLRSNDADAIYGSALQIKYSFVADPSRSNYTMRTALPLRAKTNVMSVIYSSAKPGTWKRYFRVKLTRKQYLKVHYTILPVYMDGFVSIYDAKGRYVSNTGLSSDSNGIISSEPLNKGTYYLVFSASWDGYEKYKTTGTLLQFYWQ